MGVRLKNLLAKLEKQLENTPYPVQNGYADVSGEKYTKLLEDTIKELKKMEMQMDKKKMIA